jgi:hypothetical protein
MLMLMDSYELMAGIALHLRERAFFLDSWFVASFDFVFMTLMDSDAFLPCDDTLDEFCFDGLGFFLGWMTRGGGFEVKEVERRGGERGEKKRTGLVVVHIYFWVLGFGLVFGLDDDGLMDGWMV